MDSKFLIWATWQRMEYIKKKKKKKPKQEISGEAAGLVGKIMSSALDTLL